jgi:hypothetical protein
LNERQTKAFNHCMKILKAHDRTRFMAITADLVTWQGADGWEPQEIGVDLNLEEAPEPLLFTLEDWIDQERE